MKSNVSVISKHDEYIIIATNQIKNNQLEEAKQNLIKAIDENIESPENYNLLGIIYEYLHDRQRAEKFYRVAYNFDPTFKPASKNLDRITKFFGYSLQDIDFGQMID